MVKARIAEGYPKLAQYIGKTQGQGEYPYYIPTSYRSSWHTINYKLTHGEVIVLANAGWRAHHYHFVPLRLLEEKRIPINCILTWRASYTKLPGITEDNFVVL